MKTARYFIKFENFEHSMCNDVEISKKEYNKQVKFMREQVKTNIDSEIPVKELDTKTYEKETTIETVISFICACAYTDIIKIECKDGYCFRKK